MRAPLTNQTLTINEIFYSIQGEASHMGMPCIFIRTTGCQMRCSYCDTEYAFFDGTKMTAAAIISEIQKYPCQLVEITGGEPLLQKKSLLPLIQRLFEQGYTVLMETGGGIDMTDLPQELIKIVDVKCPDSGELESMNWAFLENPQPNTVLKFVLCSVRDYEFARQWILENHQKISHAPIYFSPVVEKLAPQKLAEWMLRDGVNARLQLQLHKLLWGNQRGV